LAIFLKVLELDDTNIMAQFQVGRIYLYGIIDETTSLIDLEKARLHLKDARRYAAAELNHSPDYLDFYLEICFTLGVAEYAQAVDLGKQGNTEGAMECGRRALALFEEVENSDREFLEATYQKARCMRLLGDEDILKTLCNLAGSDKKYFQKVQEDSEFSDMVEKVLAFISDYRDRRRETLERDIIQRYRELRAEYLECENFPDTAYSNLCAKWAATLDDRLLKPFEHYSTAPLEDCIYQAPYGGAGGLFLYGEPDFAAKADGILTRMFTGGELLKEMRKTSAGIKSVASLDHLLTKDERNTILEQRKAEDAEKASRKATLRATSDQQDARGNTDGEAVYRLGDHLGGGILFYLPRQGKSIPAREYSGGGLVAAPYDQARNVTWGRAKRLCARLDLNGYNDWRLPTNNELIDLIIELYSRNLGDISGKYWSSTSGKEVGFSRFTFTRLTKGIYNGAPHKRTLREDGNLYGTESWLFMRSSVRAVREFKFSTNS
jgi:hypothetical protein